MTKSLQFTAHSQLNINLSCFLYHSISTLVQNKHILSAFLSCIYSVVGAIEIQTRSNFNQMILVCAYYRHLRHEEIGSWQTITFFNAMSSTMNACFIYLLSLISDHIPLLYFLVAHSLIGLVSAFQMKVSCISVLATERFECDIQIWSDCRSLQTAFVLSLHLFPVMKALEGNDFVG